MNADEAHIFRFVLPRVCDAFTDICSESRLAMQTALQMSVGGQVVYVSLTYVQVHSIYILELK